MHFIYVYVFNHGRHILLLLTKKEKHLTATKISIYFKPHLSGERKEWFWLSENFCVKIKAYFQVICFHVFSKRDKPSLVLIHLFCCCCKVLFNCLKKNCILKTVQELPCWLSGKESACQCRRHEFSPWSGKIPHPAEQLSLCLGAQEPQLLSPQATLPKPFRLRAHTLQQGKPPQWDAPQLELSPALHNQRKAHAAVKTQHSHK